MRQELALAVSVAPVAELPFPDPTCLVAEVLSVKFVVAVALEVGTYLEVAAEDSNR